MFLPVFTVRVVESIGLARVCHISRATAYKYIGLLEA